MIRYQRKCKMLLNMKITIGSSCYDFLFFSSNSENNNIYEWSEPMEASEKILPAEVHPRARKRRLAIVLALVATVLIAEVVTGSSATMRMASAALRS